jgi:chromosome segregation ATPase
MDTHTKLITQTSSSMTENLQSKLAAQEIVIKDLQARLDLSDKVIADLRERLEQSEQRADAAEKRADAAEKRADAAEKRADTAEKRADAAEKRADAAEKKLLATVIGKLQSKCLIYKPQVETISETHCCICNHESSDCTTTKCDHSFHTDCLGKWVSISPLTNGCPICRCRLL